jgi:predicted dehydrogenase
MRTPVRAALLGAGRIAETYAEALDTVTDIRVVAVYDSVLERAEKLAVRTESRAEQSLESLADPGRIDLAIVMTPPDTHELLCCAFLEAGVPVLCEKPLAPDLASAQRMVAAARRSGSLLTMASKFRFVADIEITRAMIARGDLGEVIRIENAFASVVDMQSRWNADPARSGGGVVIDNGVHSADIVRNLVGDIGSVMTLPGPQAQPLEVEDNALLLLRTRSGALASVELSWSTNRLTDRYLTVTGTEGTVALGWSSSRHRLCGQDVCSFGQGYDKTAAFAANLRDVAAAVRGEGTVRVDTGDALASSLVIDAAYRSLRENAWAPVAAQSPATSDV